MKSGSGDRISRIRARDRHIGEKLASQDIPEAIKGKPLQIPQFNFTISLENKVRSMFGPPYYARRARWIEDMTSRLMEDLVYEYANMADRFVDDPQAFAIHWNTLIYSLELDELNNLIEKHNTYYPMEAKLRIDPESGAPLVGSVPWEPLGKISCEGLLRTFPPDINVAFKHGKDETFSSGV